VYTDPQLLTTRFIDVKYELNMTSIPARPWQDDGHSKMSRIKGNCDLLHLNGHLVVGLTVVALKQNEQKYWKNFISP